MNQIQEHEAFKQIVNEITALMRHLVIVKARLREQQKPAMKPKAQRERKPK
jgi:hypothetical protein